MPRATKGRGGRGNRRRQGLLAACWPRAGALLHTQQAQQAQQRSNGGAMPGRPGPWPSLLLNKPQALCPPVACVHLSAPASLHTPATTTLLGCPLVRPTVRPFVPPCSGGMNGWARDGLPRRGLASITREKVQQVCLVGPAGPRPHSHAPLSRPPASQPAGRLFASPCPAARALQGSTSRWWPRRCLLARLFHRPACAHSPQVGRPGPLPRGVGAAWLMHAAQPCRPPPLLLMPTPHPHPRSCPLQHRCTT